MPEPPASAPQLASTRVTIRAEGLELQADVTVPAGPTRVSQLLPLARALADAVIEQASAAVEAAGEKVSCRAGCGACCSYLVAVSEVEARRISALINALAEPHRGEVLARFAAARQRLQAAGLIEALQHSEQWTGDSYRQLSAAYARQAVPCPLLDEQGSCSIYDERPITCREYLVTSPAQLCAGPDSQGVRVLRLPLRVFNAVARWQTPPPEHLMERVVPLILAPEWAAMHADEPAPQPGIDLLRELLQHLNEAPGRD